MLTQIAFQGLKIGKRAFRRKKRNSINVLVASSMKTSRVQGGPQIAGAQIGTSESELWVDEARFIRVAPEKLENMEPFDSENIPFWRCPKLPKHLALAFQTTTYGRRAKGDIYYWLRAKHVLENKDCTCTGKSVGWAEVMSLYQELEARVGKGQLEPRHSAQYFTDGQRLGALVQRACKGRF